MGINPENRQFFRLTEQEPVGHGAAPLRASFGDRPVRVYTLGRFAVHIDRQPQGRSTSPHQRPFEMLQALIAFGGRDVHEDLLGQALWPDAEGDHASNAFDVTLHRLRRLFGIPDLIVLRDHHLSLNSDLVWVDAWAFEQLVNDGARLLARPADRVSARQLAHCEDRLLALYQGPFLEREAFRPWSLTLRERLRSKLLRHLLDAGQFWQDSGQHGTALRLYGKGLEIEPLAEILYQRLMLCLAACGRRTDALATFERCRQVLHAQFQVPPSPATLEIFERLRSGR